jgi:hypothetical protein
MEKEGFTNDISSRVQQVPPLTPRVPFEKRKEEDISRTFWEGREKEHR